MKNKSLFNVVADTYSLYLKTQCYHWNVAGENFTELHKLFESQYENLADASDALAERIIMLGEKVPANFQSFVENSTIKAGDHNLKAKEMIKDLLIDHTEMCSKIKKVIKEYDELSDFSTVDLLTQRLANHEKQVWFLKSLLV